jgi:hypothetical protein
MPIRNDKAKADLRLLSLMAIKRGTRANQARNSKSNFGNDRIRSREDSRDNAILVINRFRA